MQFAWKGAQGEFLLSNRNEISFATIESDDLLRFLSCRLFFDVKKLFVKGGANLL